MTNTKTKPPKPLGHGDLYAKVTEFCSEAENMRIIDAFLQEEAQKAAPVSLTWSGLRSAEPAKISDGYWNLCKIDVRKNPTPHFGSGTWKVLLGKFKALQQAFQGESPISNLGVQWVNTELVDQLKGAGRFEHSIVRCFERHIGEKRLACYVVVSPDSFDVLGLFLQQQDSSDNIKRPHALFHKKIHVEIDIFVAAEEGAESAAVVNQIQRLFTNVFHYRGFPNVDITKNHKLVTEENAFIKMNVISMEDVKEVGPEEVKAEYNKCTK